MIVDYAYDKTRPKVKAFTCTIDESKDLRPSDDIEAEKIVVAKLKDSSRQLILTRLMIPAFSPI